MNKQKQQRAIIDQCGIKLTRCSKVGCMDGEFAYPSSKGICPNCHGTGYYPVPPDFLKDLNAMQMAECHIPASMRDTYQDWLSRIVEREHRMATITWLCINATPEQKAEAFLRTFKLWKNE